MASATRTANHFVHPRPGRRSNCHLSQQRHCAHTRVVTRKARCPCRHRALEGGETRAQAAGRCECCATGTFRGNSRGRFFLSKKDLMHKDTGPQPQLQAGQALHVFRSKHVATKTSTHLQTPLKVSFTDARYLSPKQRSADSEPMALEWDRQAKAVSR